MDNPVLALSTFDDGGGPVLYAGGSFTTAGGVAAYCIAKRNGSSWSPLGGGLGQGFPDAVYALTVFDDGGGGGPALYAGGAFVVPSPSFLSRIARWDGASWTPLGSGLNSQVRALEVAAVGGGPALYAAGFFTSAGGGAASHVARWNGTAWSALGSGTDAEVHALAAFDDGSGSALYAGGAFTVAGGNAANHLARWNGTAWSAVGGGLDGPVHALAVFDGGAGPALHAGGMFTQAGGAPAASIARWDGASWTPLGSGVSHPTMTPTVYALRVFDGGSGPALHAGGSFRGAGGQTAERIASWDGASWAPLGSGMNSWVFALAAFDDGSSGGPDLYAGGQFTTAGGFSSLRIAQWHGCAAGTSFCPGDGSAGACPCANDGSPGHGCQNSAASGGALLTATRTLGPDTVVLTASGELPSALSIFLQGNVQLQPGVPFGDGRRCAGGILKRLYVKSASGGVVFAPAAGDPSIQARSAALGDPIPAGGTRYYHVYYRDPSPTFCPSPPGSTFNASNGRILVW